MLHQLCREEGAAEEQAETAITVSTEQGFVQMLAAAAVLRGWGLAMQGQGEEGITQIRQGLAAWQATGAGVEQPYFLVLLAEGYGKVGQSEEGLKTLAGALTQLEKTEEHRYEAELYRLKGELTLQTSVEDRESRGKEVEACFHKAIEIARKQQAKSLELRAVMSLSRLWQHQGKREDARQMLADIYNWFTEGFDTQDLKDAKALLEDLSERMSTSE